MSSRLIIIIIIIAAALAMGFFLAWPKYQSVQQLKEEIVFKKEELSNKTDYYSQINALNDRLEQYQDSLLQVESAVSQSYSLPAVFDSLQRLSGESGLVLKDLTLDNINAQTPVKEIIVNAEVKGAYSSFRSFLLAMENSARIFNIKSISFSSPEKPTGPFSFMLTIATYSY